MPRFFLFLAVAVNLAWFGPMWATEPEEISWQQIGRGLGLAQLEVHRSGQLAATVTAVRIDPNFNAFRLFHGLPRTITDWQQETGALIMVNGGYFTPAGAPVGLVISDGVFFGPSQNPAMKGMFVAEPKGVSPDLPRATILDLQAVTVDLKKLPWSQGLMSYPLLLDPQGRLRVKNTNRPAPRTVICTDRQGAIVILHTADHYFTLYNFARFIKDSKLKIERALNLDGGSKAQLLIRTDNYTLTSPPLLEQQLRSLFRDKSLLLPTVIGVFPRRD